jgi:hypothetical protein
MRSQPVRLLFAVLLAAGATACAPSGDERPTVTTRADATSLQERRELNEAYSLLYAQAQRLSRMEWAVRLKRQPEATRDTLLAATAYYDELGSELERLSAAYPALNLEVPGMLPIHRRARERIADAQADAIKPLFGETGVEYERGLLLSVRAALDEQRHVATVLAEREPDAGLRGFMQVQQQALDQLYRRVDRELRDHYFRQS